MTCGACGSCVLESGSNFVNTKYVSTFVYVVYIYTAGLLSASADFLILSHYH